MPVTRLALAATLAAAAFAPVAAHATPVPRPPCQAEVWGATIYVTWDDSVPHVTKRGGTGYETDCPAWLLRRVR